MGTPEVGRDDDVIPLREATRAWFAVSLQTFGGPAGQIAVMQRMLVDERVIELTNGTWRATGSIPVIRARRKLAPCRAAKSTSPTLSWSAW